MFEHPHDAAMVVVDGDAATKNVARGGLPGRVLANRLTAWRFFAVRDDALVSHIFRQAGPPHRPSVTSAQSWMVGPSRRRACRWLCGRTRASPSSKSA